MRTIRTSTFDRDQHYDDMYDPDWNLLGWRYKYPCSGRQLPRPERFAQLTALAERLGAGIDFVRVDTYDWAGGLRVGELTLYDSSGLTRFTPDDVDVVLGSSWTLPHPALRALAAILR